MISTESASQSEHHEKEMTWKVQLTNGDSVRFAAHGARTTSTHLEFLDVNGKVDQSLELTSVQAWERLDLEGE